MTEFHNEDDQDAPSPAENSASDAVQSSAVPDISSMTQSDAMQIVEDDDESEM